MNAVKEDVKDLVKKELDSANEKFPMFRSTHEGYAVIKEEVEECQDCIENIVIALDEVWAGTRHNYIDRQLDDVEILKEIAIHLATEAIQVAAMAQKFMDSLEG